MSWQKGEINGDKFEYGGITFDIEERSPDSSLAIISGKVKVRLPNATSDTNDTSKDEAAKYAIVTAYGLIDAEKGEVVVHPKGNRGITRAFGDVYIVQARNGTFRLFDGDRRKFILIAHTDENGKQQSIDNIKYNGALKGYHIFTLTVDGKTFKSRETTYEHFLNVYRDSMMPAHKKSISVKNMEGGLSAFDSAKKSEYQGENTVGMYVVSKGGKLGLYYEPEQKLYLPVEYDAISYRGESGDYPQYLVGKGGLYGLFQLSDEDGESGAFVVPIEFNGFAKLGRGMYKVKRGDNFGVFNSETQRMVIDIQYLSMDALNGVMALCKRSDDKYNVLMLKDGSVVADGVQVVNPIDGTDAFYYIKSSTEPRIGIIFADGEAKETTNMDEFKSWFGE